mmetsp:Transcript_21867/g.38680  ORF Transcript_21867/g.38680 Transcript_21867/m.38680 type:complete len:146 (-) Transcript_21867:530-967(-)|eukprot:CAMPEP_0184515386 /NCGR_PEP_ID=MMETSP0198_2-20121128/4466_1 /TAXON_ID=1112570 /ORGANISM="Thraustochytrium sp., Strain LLF1b" /LENGTH=145 /DNA_ID=CAMNT_0026905633 /DNA_START=150 /DNA_END=587 /DNA_ORIENTATION=-
MSVTGRHGIGLPVVLLYEAEGLTVTIETKNNELYRGILLQTEDSMNCFMRNVTFTDKEGESSKLEQVYLRGSSIRFVVFPSALARSPMFKRVIKHKETKGRYVPQGAGTISRVGEGQGGPPGRGGGGHNGGGGFRRGGGGGGRRF